MEAFTGYRALNLTAVPKRYILPYKQDFTVSLTGCRVFPKPDLPTAHHQIPVAWDGGVKTTIVTLLDLF